MRHRIVKLRLSQRIRTSAFTAGAVTPVPPDIAGLIAWYDAEFGVTSSGGLVSAWQDRSGNGVTLSQGTGGNKPTLRSAEQNGYAAVDFSNSKFMRSGTGLGGSFAVANLGGYSVFMVMKVFTGGTSCIWDCGGVNKVDVGDYTTGSGRLNNNSLSSYHEYDVPGITYSSSTSALTVTAGASVAYYLTIFRRRVPTKQHLYAYNGSNDTKSYFANPTDGTNALMNMGISSDGGMLAAVSICEFMYYNSFIQTANLSAMVLYLTSKYGVT